MRQLPVGSWFVGAPTANLHNPVHVDDSNWRIVSISVAANICIAAPLVFPRLHSLSIPNGPRWTFVFLCSTILFLRTSLALSFKRFSLHLPLLDDLISHFLPTFVISSFSTLYRFLRPSRCLRSSLISCPLMHFFLFSFIFL